MLPIFYRVCENKGEQIYFELLFDDTEYTLYYSFNNEPLLVEHVQL